MSKTPRTDALRKTYAGISNANPKTLLDHHDALERELTEIANVLPATFFADLPLKDRVTFMYEHWRKCVVVNQELEKSGDQLKAEVERLKNKTQICPNCKEEVAFWADHIHSLPNQETSYCCFSSQQLKAELERLQELNRSMKLDNAEKWHDLCRELAQSVDGSESKIEKALARFNAMEGKV